MGSSGDQRGGFLWPCRNLSGANSPFQASGQKQRSGRPFPAPTVPPLASGLLPAPNPNLRLCSLCSARGWSCPQAARSWHLLGGHTQDGGAMPYCGVQKPLWTLGPQAGIISKLHVRPGARWPQTEKPTLTSKQVVADPKRKGWGCRWAGPRPWPEGVLWTSGLAGADPDCWTSLCPACPPTRLPQVASSTGPSVISALENPRSRIPLPGLGVSSQLPPGVACSEKAPHLRRLLVSVHGVACGTHALGSCGVGSGPEEGSKGDPASSLRPPLHGASLRGGGLRRGGNGLPQGHLPASPLPTAAKETG